MTSMLDRKTIDLLGPLGAYPQLAAALYDEVVTVGAAVPSPVGLIGNFHVSIDGRETFFPPSVAPQIGLNVPVWVVVDFRISSPVGYQVIVRFETDVMKDGLSLYQVIDEFNIWIPDGGYDGDINFNFYRGMTEPGVYGLYISLFGTTVP